MLGSPGAEKTPANPAAVGTVYCATWVALLMVWRSKPPKKNVLSLTTGPPRVAPNWFWTRGGRGFFARFVKKSFAFRTLFRRYSYALPWKILFPDLVVMLITPPA